MGSSLAGPASISRIESGQTLLKIVSAAVCKRGMSCNYLTLMSVDVFAHARHEKSGTIETKLSIEFDQTLS